MFEVKNPYDKIVEDIKKKRPRPIDDPSQFTLISLEERGQYAFNRGIKATLKAEWDWLNKPCDNPNHVGYRKPRRFCTECCSKFMDGLRKAARGE